MANNDTNNLKAIKKFRELEQGVLGVIKAADIYAIHIMAKIRESELPQDSIDSILSRNRISGFNSAGNLYHKDEFKHLEEKGHFKEIGQQIIVATHTALETYLIHKFYEYYRYLLSECDGSIIEATIKKFNFRGLRDFSKNYWQFFGIHLPSFDYGFTIEKRCNFLPKNSWEAIEIIYESRNQIVHEGKLSAYKIATPMDSWYPFEFVRGWVQCFEACFNSFIFDKQEGPMYWEHKERAKENGVIL